VIRERRVEGMENGSESAKQSIDPSSMGASSLASLKLDLSKTPFDASRIETQSSYWGLLFQLVPLLIVYPLWQLTRLFLFFHTLLWILHSVPGEHNFSSFS
jgi:hypothetical protein